MNINISVLLFFLHTVLATAIVGTVFLKRDGNIAKYFGLGLILETIAFAAWALAVISPQNLPILVTIGAVLTLVSFVFFLRSGIDNLLPINRNLLSAIGVIFIIVTFILGRYIFPTPKFISDQGLLLFNLAPFVQLMYVTALVIVFIPLVEKVAGLFNSGYSSFVKFAMSVQVVGGIILITSDDTLSLYVAGWAIGISYFVFWTSLLFKKGIWKN